MRFYEGYDMDPTRETKDWGDDMDEMLEEAQQLFEE
jgi:hypothetical protein